jgi:EAL and modified HD-GYP domain-containing signal transduction protein
MLPADIRAGAPEMTVCVARQPILDRSRRTCAYELLYRGSIDSAFEGRDADRATLTVLDTSFFVMGIDALTGGRRAHVNFGAETLVRGYASSLPPDRLVVEILESVMPDAAVLEACRELKAAGYQLALDDVISSAVPGALLELADIVKVDFRLTDRSTRRSLARFFRRVPVRLLAEKVETEAEVDEAMADGYALFQGFFFARPTVVSGREIPAAKHHLLRLLHEAYRADPDHRKIEHIIRHDVALAFKLLVHMRAAAWGQRQPVQSLRGALLLLGDRGLRRWASIVAVAALGQDRPPELVVTTLVRAAFCEGVLQELGRHDLAEDGYLAGLFSAIDAFLGQPRPEAIGRLSLPAAVVDALLHGDGPVGSVLALALAYERGAWDQVTELAAELGADDAALAERYRAAVEYASALSADLATARG